MYLCTVQSNAVAGGAGTAVLVWDDRQLRAPGKTLDTHTQDVSAVRFRPHVPRYLFSASVDETICAFDIAQPADDELQTSACSAAALMLVCPLSPNVCLCAALMVEQSVSNFGFFGENAQLLWCLTHTETLSLWDLAQVRERCALARVCRHVTC